MAKKKLDNAFQCLVNRVARKADTEGTKINVAEVSRVLSIARDELHQMLGGKGISPNS